MLFSKNQNKRMSPLFSIVIPLYNKENHIMDTLNSVLDQTLTDFEVIIVNDGSTDNSILKIKALIEEYDFIHLINQKNQGLPATRNNGINMSKGKIIALLDADDIWEKQFLHTIKELYNTFPNASVFGTDYLEQYTENQILKTKKNLSKNLKDTFFLVNSFLEANMFQPLFCQSSVAYKKEVFNQIQFNKSITYAEDIDFNILIHLQNYQVAYAFKPLSIIRLNVENQISTLSIDSKTIPDFDSYESLAINDLVLKKYLDIYRYFFAIRYKLELNNEKYNLILKNLDKKNINFTQKLYLNLPVFLVKNIKKIKIWLLKRNIRLTSFKSFNR